ncbi:MAG: sugar ABC transporter permease, partial [Clostridia bacterium]
NKSPMRAGRGTYLAFTLPPLVLYTVFFVFSVVYGLYYSFTNWNGYAKTYDFVAFKNYAKLFSDRVFKNALGFTVEYTVILVIAVNVIALLLAVLLCSKIKRQTFFRAAFFFPATLSLITIGLVFNELYYRAIPVLGKALEIDWLSKNILSSSSTAIWGILFVHVWKSVSIPMVLLIAGMQNISGDLYEAAEIDGANAIHRFFKITLPLLMPVLSVCIILVTKEGLTVYDYIMVMTSGGPAGSTQSIAFLIYENAFVNTRFSYAITQSVVIFALVCLVSFFQFKSSRRKGE